jgi:DNA repair exonuclease SbcCD ATPase subunit
MENLEELSLEDLSQKLEALEKDNEQLRRENQLFESYIKRKEHEMEQRGEDTRDMGGRRGGRRQQTRDVWDLTPDQKYEIANQELETLKSNIEEGREKSEELLERLKAILEGTDLNIAEIRKEAFDFGRFLSSSENGRTGKYDADKLMKYMDDKFRQKEALMDKLQLKNISLKNQILKAESSIRHKEEMGDDLKFIDFHQLQIENKKHVRDIDERNNRLLAIKLHSGKTVQTLNDLKKTLNMEMQKEQDLTEQIEEMKKKRKETDVEILKTNKEARKYSKSYRNLDAQKNRNKDMPGVDSYVEQKEEAAILKNSVKNWKRKIEIAKIASKECDKIIKRFEKQNAMMDDEAMNE